MSRMPGQRKENRSTKIAYFDCFSGISGDMCLGAIVDAGAPLKEIERGLRRLPIGGYRLSAKKVKRAGFSATKVDVLMTGNAVGKRPAVRLGDVEEIIRESSLPDDLKANGNEIFRRLFAAEGKVHGEKAGKVHLHELGAVDCLVDIFGTLTGLELLGASRVFSSPLNLGGGVVKTEHGLLPVPAPATAEIVRGLPVYSSGVPFELTTPTGAVLMKSLADGFGPMPLFTHEKTGTGAGGRDIKGSPNVLRIFVGEAAEDMAGDRVTVIETNIDDMNPQIYEYVSGRLFAQGARDVFLSNLMMKKMRPGTKLSVICDAEKRDSMIRIILDETTSIGVRYYETPRVTLKRESRTVWTRFGKVRVKAATAGRGVKWTPEYEDCRRLAKKSGAALAEVIEEAKRAAGLIGGE